MKFSRVPAIVLSLLLLSSCVVTQSIDFSSNTGSTALKSEDFLVCVIEDLSCWTGQENSDAFFDVAVTGIAKSIASSDYSKYVYINKSPDGGYEISYGFSDLNALFNQLSQDTDQNILRLSKSSDPVADASTTLEFELSMDNYDSLKKIIPLLSDPNFEAYGPVYNNPPYDNRSEEDYIYMMEFIFGEGASTIATSTVSIIIETPTPIIETSGTRLSDTETAFQFRLVDFLLLHDPIRFSCRF